jgi:hypothetical protein
MRRIFRDNPLLAISIALPVAVVLLFAGATAIPKLFTDPPAYDLLLSLQHGDSSRLLPYRLQIVVEDNRVVARVAKLGQYEQGYMPRLFRYNHESGSVLEVNILIPADTESIENGTLIPIPELDGLRISPELRAPDGYEFRGQGSAGGLMMELFGSSRNSRKITVEKNGAVVRIRLPEDDYWYYGMHFLGWVVSGDS